MQNQNTDETHTISNVRDSDKTMVISENLLTGPAVEASLEALAALRIDIFREYPYLYDGIRDDELKYLRHYMETPHAFVIAVNDSDSMIGAATGTPLCYEPEDIIYRFAGTSYPVTETFYVGELLFYPAYRNGGLGLRLLEKIEEYVCTLGTYRYLTCATVVRPDNHTQCPEIYVPINRFLARSGFNKLSDVTTSFAWREIDGTSRDHPMQFWVKELF